MMFETSQKKSAQSPTIFGGEPTFLTPLLIKSQLILRDILPRGMTI